MSNHIKDISISYIPAFDGIRAISILIVFIAHLGFEHLIPGGLGVTIFFFISGFLITRLLIKEHSRLNTIELKNFFIRRLLRLYPPLLLFVLVMVILILLTEKTINAHELLAAIFYFENYYVLFSDDIPKRFQILWSLAIEEHFYLVFPFLFLAFIRRLNLFIGVMILLSLIMLFIRFFVVQQHGPNDFTDVYTYSLSHCRADSILYGCLLSLILHADKENNFLRFASNYAVFAGSLILLLFTLIYRDDAFRQTIRYSLQGIALLIIIPPILYSTRYVFLTALLSNKILIFIGKLSYSIYLFHWVGLYIGLHYFSKGTPGWYLVNIVVTSILAIGSYYSVEKTVTGLRHRFGSVAPNAKAVPVSGFQSGKV